MIVRVVNRETGEQVWPARGFVAQRIAPPSWARESRERDLDGNPIAWVKITPSAYEGAPHDLATYPASWVEDLADLSRDY